ncbi:hypothetical protein FQ087_21065 [Sporosarcina sp. ANT_H38]|nr:hypothetical protein FQ087_21065 [Sporosarcina sp. ANT_H38]
MLFLYVWSIGKSVVSNYECWTGLCISSDVASISTDTKRNREGCLIYPFRRNNI